MVSEHVEPQSRIGVSFKRSSTKDGGEGYDIYVGEGADAGEADRVMALAKELRSQALAALRPPSLEEKE